MMQNSVLEPDFKVMTNNKLVCPFRTHTQLVPNQYNAADQVIMFPECHYIECPFYDDKAKDNFHRCMKVISFIADVNP